jgi:inosose dehydratase
MSTVDNHERCGKRMASIRVANAPCSWGVLEFEDVKGASRVTWSQMLDELRETGYEGTELGDWGYLPTAVAVLREELKRRQLQLVAAFVPVALKEPEALAEGLTRALRTAHLLAAVAEDDRDAAGGPPASRPLLVLADENGRDPLRTQQAGRVTPALSLNAAQWRSFARAAEQIARTVQYATGLRTAFHHHCAGYVETPAEIERLLELTDPALLGLVFDTGHYLYGTAGGDPSQVETGLRRFAARIWHVHFKDCDLQVAQEARRQGWDYFTALRHGLFCELGQGGVPFAAVLTALQQQRYTGWIVVEQDVLPGMGSPKSCARRNRDYLRTMGL